MRTYWLTNSFSIVKSSTIVIESVQEDQQIAALNITQESATEPANSHRLLADVGAGTMQPPTGAAAPTMAKNYSLPSGTTGH